VPPDYRLIAVTAPDPGAKQIVLDGCLAAVAGGATAIQIRLKRATAAELCRTTERLLGAVDVPVYVNDRLDVAIAAGAHGVHLGADDFPPDRVQMIAPATLRVGVSVGSDDEATDAAAIDAHYWSLGPFFHTGSKADAGAPLGHDGFTRLARLAPAGVPVIAIGGIDSENVGTVIDAGAHGVAIVSAIFGASDIEAATRRIRDAMDAALGRRQQINGHGSVE
jgi:thiamine-phosphate pyrophosphorylase